MIYCRLQLSAPIHKHLQVRITCAQLLLPVALLLLAALLGVKLSQAPAPMLCGVLPHFPPSRLPATRATLVPTTIMQLSTTSRIPAIALR